MGICVLCPTRWSVRVAALSSILANYSVLMQVWEEAKGIARDTETIGRINGVSAKFSFLFGVVLGKLILGHSHNLSKSLQVKTLTPILPHQCKGLEDMMIGPVQTFLNPLLSHLALDLVISSKKERFDQTGFRTYQNLQ